MREFSSSDIARPFAGAPQAVAEYFSDAVQRLMHDNLDYLVSASWDHDSFEALHLIDAHPVPRKPLRYHYVYESFNARDESTRLPTRKMGLVVTRVPWEVYNPTDAPRPSRSNTSRYYSTSDQESGFVVRRHKAPGVQVTHILEGFVEDAAEVDDPLDTPAVRTLKEDIARLRIATPLRPASNLINQVV